MKFKFPFESVIKYRKQLEDEARREFEIAQMNLDQCLQLINQMYQQMDDSRNRILELQNQPPVDIASIRQNEEFIEGQKIRIQSERLKARGLMAIMEEKQGILIEKAKEHKILLKLKDKRKVQFLKDKRKVEQKRMDDLVTMRFKVGEDV